MSCAHSKGAGHEESEVQLQVLTKRMSDIEELEEKAIREVLYCFGLRLL